MNREPEGSLPCRQMLWVPQQTGTTIDKLLIVVDNTCQNVIFLFK